MIIEDIARIAHNVNRAYCLSMKDDTQPTWEAAPEWQKKSAIAGVEAHLKEALTPEESHKRWLALKKAEGWTYGAVKCIERKKHPCMVDYHSLSDKQKAKDYIFSTVVAELKNFL